MKNSFIKLLFVAVSLFCTTTIYAQTFEVDGIAYYVTDAANKTVEVTYNGTSNSSGSIVIPEAVNYNGETYSVTNIGKDAFYSCSSLASIVIPNSVTSIGNYAFSYCFSLTNIEIPNSVTSIGDSAFAGCSSLTNIVIPNSVTSIGNNSFSFCDNLTKIDIPNSVTNIGEWAFHECPNLTSVTIGNSVASIGEGVFTGCPNIKSMIVVENNNVYDSRENCNAIIETSTNTLIVGCKNTKIPSSVIGIGYRAFYFCSSLTDIAIPNSVTNIGKNAFYACESLTNITIPNSVTSIGEMAFGCCYELTNITIPNSITSLENGVFFDCKSLTHIEIPNSVTRIGDWVFERCNNLTKVTIPNSVTRIGDWVFERCKSLKSIYCLLKSPIELLNTTFENVDYDNVVLYVPIGSKAEYETTAPWDQFVNIQEMDFTGIDNITTEPTNNFKNAYYNLNGSVVENPTNGIYIINGKKVLVK